jgi:translation initiation factor IF-3
LSRPFPSRHSSQSGSFIRVNGKIRAREVRVISEDGKQVGILSLGEALTLGGRAGLIWWKLPQRDAAGLRLVDYGKFRYEQNKREKNPKSTSTPPRLRKSSSARRLMRMTSRSKWAMPLIFSART